MKPFAIILVLGISVLSSSLLWGGEIKGTVKDIHNRPLAAVNILVQETGAVTLSDGQGKFLIRVPTGLDRLVLSLKARDFHPQTLRVSMDRDTITVNVLLIPREHLKEEISVTALNKPEQSVSVPMAESRVSQLEIQEKVPENIVSTMLNTPGIHFIGKGGISVTPSIRGLARRRVLVLVDGARLTSDRRVGVSAELIPPEFSRRVEIVRSASSVIYGSDAIGGVVQVLTRAEEPNGLEKNALNLNLNSNNRRLNTGIGLHQKIGSLDISSGFQFSHAGNYAAPDGEIFNSGYTYYSGRLDVTINSEKRDLWLGYLGGFGQDVGKPERGNNPDIYSYVPEESEQFIRLQYREKTIVNKGSLDLSLFVNPSHYRVDQLDLTQDTSEQADTDVTNLGLKLALKKSPLETFSYRIGFEWFSRQNLRMANREQQEGQTTTTLPLANGRRSDYGLFVTLDYSGLPGFDIMTGVRYSFFSIGADVGGQPMEKSSGAPSAFLGITRKLGDSVSLFVNVGKAFRLPSLSESFYTGLTGRRYVVGNPGLEPESSFNMDAGLKWFSERFFLGIYGFYYSIDDMIERYRNEEGIYTYDNIDRGRVSGAEVEFQFFPAKNLELFGHFFYYRGRSTATGQPLNDVPSPKLFLGGKFFLDRLWAEVNYTLSFRKTDPGPAETANDTYHLLELKGGYYFSANFYLYLKAANLLDQSYFANPDPDIPHSPGLSLSTGLHLYF
jgi:hemoglobin/transferrin/lactoferrin receptor protein